MRLISRKTLPHALLIAAGLVLVPSTLSQAEPSPGIQTLIRTPASTFDVFLFKLFTEVNGVNYFEGVNRSQPLQCFRLEYDPDRNVIDLWMHIVPPHKLLEGWKNMTSAQKKALMIEAARETARSLGVEDREKGPPSGCIQRIQLRNGWATNDFDEAAVKEELRSRVLFTLILPPAHELAWHLGERNIHKVTRTLDGKYVYSHDDLGE
jgi:hypothetical protein